MLEEDEIAVGVVGPFDITSAIARNLLDGDIAIAVTPRERSVIGA